MSGATHDVVRRARAGVLLVMVRGVSLRLFMLASSVVLARILGPAELGQAALALAIAGVGRFVADAGLLAALVRAPEEPDPRDIAACVAGQLVVTLLLVAAAGTAFGFDHGSTVLRLTAVLSLSLPLVALRAPGLVRLERDLHFRPVAVAESLEGFTTGVVAVLAAVGGAGPDALAWGGVAGAVTGTVILANMSREGWVRPVWDTLRLRRMLPLALAQQLVGALNVLRDQGLNLGIYLISGPAVLGVWTVAYRVLQVPFLLFEGLWRVSFPVMSRLVKDNVTLRPVVERGVALAGVWTGLLVAGLVGPAPALVPFVFGDAWRGAVWVLPLAGLSLVVGGPVSAAGVGLLFAVGDVRRVVRATVVHTLCWLVIGLSLIPLMGLPGVSVGWLVGGVLETVMFARGLRAHTGARLTRHVVPAAAAATLAGSIAWWVASSQPVGPLAVLSAGLSAAAAYAAVMAAVDRPALVRAVRELSSALRG